MDLNLEVLSTCSIKKKTRSNKVQWVGRDRESLVIFDGKKTQCLYLPTGKTSKKKVVLDKLPSFLQDSVVSNSFCFGQIVASIQKSGEILLYWRDNGSFELIPGLPEFNCGISYSQRPPFLYVGDNGRHILLVLQLTDIYIWERSESQSTGGKWHKIPWHKTILSPTIDDNDETELAASFYNQKLLGCCTVLTFAFVCRDEIFLPSVIFIWEPDMYGKQKLRTHWLTTHFPYKLSKDNRVIPGMLKLSFSPTSPLLAMTINHLRPCDTLMVYVDPLNGVATSRPLFGMGVSESNKVKSRHTWIVDLHWDYSGNFVLGISGLGLLSICYRFDSPLMLQSHGCCVELGPAFYLAMHPFLASNAHSHPGTLQLYTISIHSRQPVFLVSDGFQVTVLRLPVSVSMPNVVHRHLNECCQALSELDPDFQLQGGQFDCLQDDSQELAAEQMARVAQWTANINAPGEAEDGQQPFGLSRNPSEMRLSDLNINDEDSDEYSLNDVAPVPPPSNLRKAPSASALSVGFGSASNVNILTPAEHSDSGLHSMFGDLSNPDTWIRRARHHLMCSMGFLLSDNGGGQMAALKEALCNEILSVWYRMMNSLFFTLSDLDPINAEDSLVYVFEELACQLSELFSIVCVDSVDQACYKPLVNFLHELIRLLIFNQSWHSCFPLDRCLQICLHILENGERTISSVYSWSEVAVEGFVTRWWPSRLAFIFNFSKPDSSPAPVTGLRPTWFVLNKIAVKLKESYPDKPQLNNLCESIDNCLTRDSHFHKEWLSNPEKVVFSHAEQLLLEGKDEEAILEWQEEIRQLGQQGKPLHGKKLSRCLHSLFYLAILRGEIRYALHLVNRVAGMSSDPAIKEELPFLQPFKRQLKNKWQLFLSRRGSIVRSASRFMAAYFSNSSIYIFPPHSPQMISSIVESENREASSRQICIPASTLTNLINKENLSDLFHVERCMELLLVSGLMEEATLMSKELGDWRTCMVLGWASRLAVQEEKITGMKLQISACLPKELEPETVLFEHAKSTIDKIIESENIDPSSDEICLGFRDIFTAACMAHVQLLEPLMDYLVHERLLTLVKALPIFVDQTFYLPAPPLFCPQPGSDKSLPKSSHAGDEVAARRTISCVISLITTVLHAAFSALPCVGWYTQQLIEAQRRAMIGQLRQPIKENNLLDNLFSDYLPMGEKISEIDCVESVRRLLIAHRDFCSLIWCLTVRDKLSLLTRQRAQHILRTESEWLTYCSECLDWTLHMLPFSRLFGHDSTDLYLYFLSLINEFDPEPDIAYLLVEWDFQENNCALSTPVLTRLREVLKSWTTYMSDPSRTVFIKSRRQKFVGTCPKGESLSVFYHKMLQKGKAEAKKRKDVFHHVNQYPFDKVRKPFDPLNAENLCVGSRIFETEDDYLDCLDMFFSVSYSKILEKLDKSREQNDVPLILGFEDIIAEREFSSMAHIAMNGSMTSPRSQGRPMPSPRSIYSKGSENTNDSDDGPPSPRPRSVSSQNSGGGNVAAMRCPRPQRKSTRGMSERSSSYDRKTANQGFFQRSNSVEESGTPPRLNLTGLNVNASSHHSNSNNHIKMRRASLSDYRDKIQTARDQQLFTPRSDACGYKTAPFITDLEIDNDKQSLYDRMNWLVRWTYRFQGSPFAKSGNESATLMRIRLNTNVLVYTVFGVSRPRKSSHRSTDVPPHSHKFADAADRDQDLVEENLSEDLKLDLGPLKCLIGSRRKADFRSDAPPPRDKGGGGEASSRSGRSHRQRNHSEDDSCLSILSDGSNTTLVSHSDKLRNVARIQLADFMKEAKNVRGPSEERDDSSDSARGGSLKLEQEEEEEEEEMERSEVIVEPICLQENNSSIPPPKLNVTTPTRSDDSSTSFDVSSFLRHPSRAVISKSIISAFIQNKRKLHPESHCSAVQSSEKIINLSDSFEGLPRVLNPPDSLIDSPQINTKIRSETMAANSQVVQVDPKLLAQEMQNVFRGEMKKIFQVQHASMISLLGALDTNEPQYNNPLHLDLQDESLTSPQRSTDRYRSYRPKHEGERTPHTNGTTTNGAPRKPMSSRRSGSQDPPLTARSTNRSEDLTDVTTTDFITDRHTHRHSENGRSVHDKRKKSKQRHRSGSRDKVAATEAMLEEHPSQIFDPGHGAAALMMHTLRREINIVDAAGLGSPHRHLDLPSRHPHSGDAQNHFLHGGGTSDRMFPHIHPYGGKIRDTSPHKSTPQAPFPLLQILPSNQSVHPSQPKSQSHRSRKQVWESIPLLSAEDSTGAHHQQRMLGSHLTRNPSPRLLPPDKIFPHFRATPGQEGKPPYPFPLLEFHRDIEAQRAEIFGKRLLQDKSPSHREPFPPADQAPHADENVPPCGSSGKQSPVSQGSRSRSNSAKSSPTRSMPRGIGNGHEVGVQYDSVSDSEIPYIHHGFAFMPGFLSEGKVWDHKAIGPSPREYHDVASPRKDMNTMGLHLGKSPILPPDLVEKLQYGCDPSKRGRQFLSVVSVDDGLWHDIVGQAIPPISEDALSQRAPLSERDRPPSHRESSREVIERKGDAVTQALFSQRQELVTPPPVQKDWSSNSKSRLGVLQTLEDMDKKLRNLDEVSRKIERGYNNTTRFLPEKPLETHYPAQNQYSRSGEHVKRASSAIQDNSHVSHEEQEIVPPSVALDITEDTDVTQPSPERAQLSSNRPPGVAALDFTSLIGRESPRKPPIYTTNHIPDLVKRSPVGILSRRSSLPDSLNLSPTATTTRHCHQPHKRSQAEREEIKKWDAKKRAEKMEQFKKERQRLVESEAHPFVSQGGRLGSAPPSLRGTLDKSPERRQIERREREKQIALERQIQLKRMIDDMMSEYEEPILQSPKKPIHLMKAPSATELISSSIKHEQRQKQKKLMQMERAAALWEAKQRATIDNDEFLTFEEYDDFVDRMTELSNAATSDAGASDLNHVPQSSPPKPRPLKPLTEVVQMQRPEITRIQSDRRVRPKTYGEKLAEINKIPVQYENIAKSPRKDQLSSRGALRSNRKNERPKPYNVPYTESRDLTDDDASQFSDWVVPSEIHRMLYNKDGDSGSNMTGPSMGEGSELSKLSDLYEYDGVSVHSGSMLDWDRVDEMVS